MLVRPYEKRPAQTDGLLVRIRPILVFLAVSAGCAFIYVMFIRPSDEVETPIDRLSRYVDAHMAQIFSPLTGTASPQSYHELRQLRASLADRFAHVRMEERAMYQVAISLCDTLMTAVAEREQTNLSLIDTRSKPYSTDLFPNRRTTTWQEKRTFFEGGIQYRWAERANAYRVRADALYRQLREHERRLRPNPTPAPLQTKQSSILK